LQGLNQIYSREEVAMQKGLYQNMIRTDGFEIIASLGAVRHDDNTDVRVLVSGNLQGAFAQVPPMPVLFPSGDYETDIFPVRFQKPRGLQAVLYGFNIPQSSQDNLLHNQFLVALMIFHNKNFSHKTSSFQEFS